MQRGHLPASCKIFRLGASGRFENSLKSTLSGSEIAKFLPAAGFSALPSQKSEVRPAKSVLWAHLCNVSAHGEILYQENDS